MNNQYGNPPEGMQGYGQAQTGRTAPQAPYIQNTEQGYTSPVQQGYDPYSGMPSGQQSAPYSIPAQMGNNGSYIPQTPYSPGYTSPGYQPPAQAYLQQGGYSQQSGYQTQGGYSQQSGYQAQNGYQAPMNGYPLPGGASSQNQPLQGGYMPGYNPYGQMGRTQQNVQPNDYNPGIPLNGGGYVPQKVPVRRRPFEVANWMLIASGVILITLFVAAVLILKNTPLKITLIFLATGSSAVLWIKPLTAENKRLTYTILALSLSLLTVFSFLLNQPNDPTRNGNDSAQNIAEEQKSGNVNGEVPEIPMSGSVETATPAPETASSELMTRLVTFFIYWSENRQDEMLTLCAPSWISKQESPRTSLFTLIGNRNPTDCTPETITGTDADSSRRVTLKAKIDRHNGKKPELYRFTILMVKENNEWYIDPQSLQSNETVETPDPNVTPTVTPTATPYVDANTQLYYNPNGGEYYHLDAYCKTANARNLPFAGQFTYGQLNDPPYNDLKPCNVCGAPLREQ